MIDRNRFQGGRSTCDGELFALQSDDGTRATVTSYGARLVSLEVPAGCGRLVDVALGYASLDDYYADRSTYFGATVGRYANRIAGGRLRIAGRDCALSQNEGAHALHGGMTGFDARVWQATQPTGHSVHFSLASPDADQGFPGRLEVEVVYRLEYRSLRIDYRASTDAPTVVNLSNHTYFNLAGEGEGTIGDHILLVAASRYTPIDPSLIPLGLLSQVQGTPFDLRTPTPMGIGLASHDPQIAIARGYDHNFALDGGRTSEPRSVARLFCPRSGLAMTVLTTEPGLQLYTGNGLDGTRTGKSASAYLRYGGLCLETQHFPDSPNQPVFPSTLLRPGDEYRSSTIYRFE